MAASKPQDLVKTPMAGARSGLPRPVDLVQTSRPPSTSNATNAPPASMPNGGPMPFGQSDGSTSAVTADNPSSTGPLGVKRCFSVG